MKTVAILGCGMGYPLAAYLSHLGHPVVGIDIDENAIKNPRIDDNSKAWIKANCTSPPFPRFTTSYSEITNAEYILVFVSTPVSGRRLSNKNVFAAIDTARRHNEKATFLIMSTLHMGAMKTLKMLYPKLRIFYTPITVRHHDFIRTFITPPADFQMIGANGEAETAKDVVALYQSWLAPNTPIVVKSADVVELAKLLDNFYLSAKIITSNAVGEWVERGLAEQALDLVQLDPRIGRGYLKPGIGPAGPPCFPRDLIELEAVATGDFKSILRVLNATNRTNEIIANARVIRQ